jgi:hypothetical protein
MPTLSRIPRTLPLILAVVVALLVAGTTGAVAAKKITGKDIAANTITSANIKNGTLAAADFSAAAKKSLKGATGATGATGPAGPAGPAGQTGPAGQNGAGLDGFGFYQSVATDVPANTDNFVVEGDCPTGQSIVGAWAYWATNNSALQVSVGFIDDTTMAAVAYSTGIPEVQNATMQFSCATLPLPAKADRHMLNVKVDKN